MRFRLCKGINEAKKLSTLKEKSNSNYTEENASHWTHIVIVRDPLERFISGFLDKCRIHKIWETQNRYHCFQCKDDLSCFLKRLDEHMRNPSIRILNMDTHHFIPQSLYCEMGTYMFNNYTIIKFSRKERMNFLNKLTDVLRKQEVPEDTVSIIRSQITDGETEHSTFSLKMQKQRLYEELKTPENAIRFLQLYYYDYKLFGFPLPDFK